MRKYLLGALLGFCFGGTLAWANEYYNATGTPAANSSLSSSAMRAEFTAIDTGFDKLPPMSAYPNYFVGVNSGGTALTVLAIYEQGSFTVAWETACTTTPSVQWSYVRIGNVVTIIPATPLMSCTSDATTTTASTDLPATIRPDTALLQFPTTVKDNGVAMPGCINILDTGEISASNTANCSTSNAWTAAGTKEVVMHPLTYTL